MTVTGCEKHRFVGRGIPYRWECRFVFVPIGRGLGRSQICARIVPRQHSDHVAGSIHPDVWRFIPPVESTNKSGRPVRSHEMLSMMSKYPSVPVKTRLLPIQTHLEGKHMQTYALDHLTHILEPKLNCMDAPSCRLVENQPNRRYITSFHYDDISITDLTAINSPFTYCKQFS